MTAPVVHLDIRRQARDARRTCPGCGPELCYPHRLEALALRLRAAGVDSALLVPAELLVDTLTVLDGITSACLPDPERNAR